MNLEISFRHLEHTDSIDGRIREKIERIQKKHFTADASFKWTSWVEHKDHITTLHAYDKGKEYFVKASASNLYKTIDLVIHKIEGQFNHQNH